MTDAPLSPENEDAALAGEFALRLLTAEEERAVRERIATEPAFAALVREWENQFSTIAEEVDEVAPDVALRKALLARAFEEPELSLWQRFGIWRWVAVAAVVVGAAILIAPLQISETPDYMAELVAEDGSIAVTASYFAESQDVLIEVTSGAAPEGRVLQVWGILERQAPVSLGVIPADGSGRFAVPAELKGKWAGLICAVSEEPPGGSPTGLPTGDVLATAELRQL